MPKETDGKVVVQSGLEVTNPDVDASYEISPDLPPNQFPLQKGITDTYTGIPGDGVVPG